MASPSWGGAKEPDIQVAQCPLVLRFKLICSPLCSLSGCSPRKPSLARTFDFQLCEAIVGAVRGWEKETKVRHFSRLARAM